MHTEHHEPLRLLLEHTGRVPKTIGNQICTIMHSVENLFCTLACQQSVWDTISVKERGTNHQTLQQ
jgi:hypothetical protein